MTHIGQTMLSATLPPLATRPLRDGRLAGDCVEDLSEGKAFSFWFNFSSGLSSQRNSGVSLSPLFSDSAESVCVFFFFFGGFHRWLGRWLQLFHGFVGFHFDIRLWQDVTFVGVPFVVTFGCSGCGLHGGRGAAVTSTHWIGLNTNPL